MEHVAKMLLQGAMEASADLQNHAVQYRVVGIRHCRAGASRRWTCLHCESNPNHNNMSRMITRNAKLEVATSPSIR